MLPLYGACAFSITTCDERRKLSSNLLRSTFLLCVSRHRARKDQDQSEIIFSAAIWSHGKTSGQVGFLTLQKSQNEFLGSSPHPIIRRQPIAADIIGTDMPHNRRLASEHVPIRDPATLPLGITTR